MTMSTMTTSTSVNRGQVGRRLSVSSRTTPGGLRVEINRLYLFRNQLIPHWATYGGQEEPFLFQINSAVCHVCCSYYFNHHANMHVHAIVNYSVQSWQTVPPPWRLLCASPMSWILLAGPHLTCLVLALISQALASRLFLISFMICDLVQPGLNYTGKASYVDNAFSRPKW